MRRRRGGDVVEVEFLLEVKLSPSSAAPPPEGERGGATPAAAAEELEEEFEEVVDWGECEESVEEEGVFEKVVVVVVAGVDEGECGRFIVTDFLAEAGAGGDLVGFGSKRVFELLSGSTETLLKDSRVVEGEVICASGVK